MSPFCIFITGGAGFIGSALVDYLIRHTHYHVVNIDKLSYAGHLSSITPLLNHSHHTFVQADINDTEQLATLFRRYQPCGLIHLAAESHVDNAIQAPNDFIQTNIVGTFSLLQTSLNYWQRLPETQQAHFRFHHISTDEVFGELAPQAAPFSEQHPYHPQNPYSASKAAADHLVRAWQHTYGLPVIVSHCSNNYGPRQLPEKLIPKLITHAIQGKSLPIYGDGDQIRDWLHVDDHVAAMWQVFQHGRLGHTYNIGAQNEWRNLNLTHLICDLLDQRLPCHQNPHTPKLQSYRELITHVPDRSGHDVRYAINPAKIQSTLGWAAQIDFKTGLLHTIDWYLTHPEWWHPLQKLR